MRFITEFKVPEYFEKNKRIPYVPGKRYLSEVKMGNMIAQSFDWQNPVNHNLEHHRLEIEAFPMDKWIEFKNKLLFEIQESAIHGIPISPIRTLELIKDLEFYANNKQKIDELTNPIS